ncbi:uncharacterized protein LOC142985612 [Anticarsia gemmatalis]|uniref:uncharacterized protein LOC142985612 n=1 Tax=Anticarsia gemmatalis TaxID=129554 RepID=UPI003F771E9B
MFRSHKDTMRTPVKQCRETSRKYYCDICKDTDGKRKVWCSESDVDIHRRKAHKVLLMQLIKDENNHMCTVCLRKQKDRPTLVAHIKTQHLYSTADATFIKREIFICDYCNNIFFNKLLLIAHIKFQHTPNAERRTATTICPVCFKTVLVKNIWFHFLYHGIYHSGTCPICLDSFQDSQELLEHIDTHPGYYQCRLCPYDTKRDNLFRSHIEKHRKNIILEDNVTIDSVLKYYLPPRRIANWNRKFLNLLKGVTLAPEVQICVLCRMIFDDDHQMMQHIYGDHSPIASVDIKRHMCTCGEEFFNNVLLKHHIFVMKGDHKVWDASTHPIVESEQIITLPTQSQAELSSNGPQELQLQFPVTENVLSSNQNIQYTDNLVQIMVIDEMDVDRPNYSNTDVQTVNNVHDSTMLLATDLPSESHEVTMAVTSLQQSVSEGVNELETVGAKDLGGLDAAASSEDYKTVPDEQTYR